MKWRILLIMALFTNALFSQTFHDTQGKLEISNNGQASFTLPIALPPSIKEVGPTINLVYSSGQNSGIAGQGWELNGISNISRISTRRDIEGYVDGVDFDIDDKLSLDGQRLLLKSGTYWADGSTYETEVQSNNKIELKGSGNTIYFIVTTPDGSRSWYGNYAGINGVDTTAFYMVRFEDVNGNFIIYNYTKPFNKSLCINDIQFSANKTTNPSALNKVVFTYKQANRKESAFIKGIKIEKVELLDKIEVFTNNALFKKYQLTHVSDNQGYQRVSQIQEFNGAQEGANPILFEYKTTPENVTENETLYTDSLDLSTSPDMSGDFDGDGRVDFISGSKLYTKLFQGAGTTYQFPYTWGFDVKRVLFAATTLTNNKLNQKQSVVKVEEGLSALTFKVYNLETNGIVNSYSRTIEMDNAGNCSDECVKELFDPNGDPIPDASSKCTSATYAKKNNKYIEGDFNGDSVSDVLILSYDESKTYKSDPPPPPSGSTVSKENPSNIIDPAGGQCYWHIQSSKTIKEARIVDLNPASPTANNTFGNYALTSANIQLLQNGQRFVVDFNSDGKADILVIESNKNYKVLSFKQLTVAPWAELEVIGQGVLDAYSTSKQILFGDFNGDGKSDVLLPEADGIGCEGCNLWHIYFSNPNPAGGSFFTKESYTIAEYRPSSGDNYNTQWHSSSYYAMDINKDGKSDLVRVWTSLWQYSPFWDPKDIDSSWSVVTYLNNIGLNGGFVNNYTSPTTHDNNDNSRPIAMTGNYKYKGLDSDLLMIRFHQGNSFDKTVNYIDFKKDFSEDNLLLKVSLSNGAIVDELVYDAMIPADGTNGLGNTDGFYSSTESLEYPLVEIKQMTTNKLVSKLKNTSLGVVKFQDFKYHGLTINLNGIGVVGFKKTARSSWYKSSLDNKNWSVTENNPVLRGATIKTYSLLLNGNEFLNFGSNYTNLINKTENTFTESSDATSKRYALLLKNQTTTNYLNNVVKQKIYNSYSSDFMLPESVTINTLLGTQLQGSTTTITTYDNNSQGADTNYYVGRPIEENTTKTVYVNTKTGNPDTKTSAIKYFYTNGNVTQLEKKANNSAETIVEKMTYFPTGQIQSKTIDAIGTTVTTAVTARTTTYTYDSTNRFIKTITDPEGLITENVTYHNLFGTILTQKNPFNQVITYAYDDWGKKVKTTDFLGKSMSYSYTKTGNLYTSTQTGDDGSSSMTESDALARIIRKGAKDLNGNWVYTNIEYDYLGKKIKESDPYAGTSASLWTVYEYDDYNRPVKTTAPSGKVITTTYNGLTVVADDGKMSKSKTMNANGQVIVATDSPGGTIQYKFDANDNLVESDYQGIKITMQYDDWGRKVQLTDSSAGTYTYSYNAFGETKTETTPKGSTTYTLNSVGKVLTKSVTGDGTSITSTYTYDPTYKWLTSIVVVNPNDGNSSYVYSYDATTMLLNKTVENLYPVSSTTPLATFTKELTFDAFGRVNNETATASSHGKTSSKTITHTYKNGMEWQLLEGGVVKWQADAVNARGQLTNATLGNGIAITNTYDDYGFVTENKHIKTGTNPITVMSLQTTFEPKLGNLTSRYNSLMDSKEGFGYDNLDRLIAWSDDNFKILKNTFNSGIESFTTTGTGVTLSNYLSQLKVVASGGLAGAKKQVLTTAVVEDVIQVRTDFTKVSGNSNVHVVVVETDPTTGDFIETEIGMLTSGATFKKPYKIQQYPLITVCFRLDEGSGSVLKSNSQTQSIINPGGGPAPTATYYLDNFTISKITYNYQQYDDRGRITQNAQGKYNYNLTPKPYQNTSIDPLTAEAQTYYNGRGNLNISYNAFKAPIQIEELGIDKISFGYNAMLQRSTMYYGNTETDKLKRPYRKYFSADGSMEIKATFVAGNTATPTNVEFITYIGGDAYSASAIVKSDGTTQDYFYLHRDYQGSIMAITNASGAVVEKRLYNPWGEIIKVQDGAGNTLTKLTFFDRGYTGHQHLESVGLIHMNGRLYDYKLHRFLQPDNFVQDPYNTQSFNRYGYCWNNPLKYTDKNGEELVSSILIGAGIALASYFTMNLVNGQPITLKGALVSTFVGALSGAVTFGIGTWTSTIGNFTLKASTQALSHGIFQGTLSGFQGGGFWTGFASGSLSSIASSAFSGGMNTKVIDGKRYNIADTGWAGAGKFAKNTAGMIAFGTVMGGAGAALTGGNFWKGAVTGLVVSALNHAMPQHSGKELETAHHESQKLTSNQGTVETIVEVDYYYKIVGDKKVLIDGNITASHEFNNVLNPFDNYDQDFEYERKINQKFSTFGDKIVFELKGTHTEGAVKVPIPNASQTSIGMFKRIITFTGIININDSTSSFYNIQTTQWPRLWK